MVALVGGGVDTSAQAGGGAADSGPDIPTPDIEIRVYLASATPSVLVKASQVIVAVCVRAQLEAGSSAPHE